MKTAPVPRVAEPASLVEALRFQAALRPGRRAFVFLADGEVESERLTYRGLDRRARAVAALLARRGAKGERVLLLLPPGLDFVAAFFGCLYAGAVAVPAYPPRSERSLPRLRAIAGDAGPCCVLASGDGFDRLRRITAGVPELDGVPWLSVSRARGEKDWRESQINREDLAFLQYTSGSTSDPKGVRVTHGNLLANAGAISRAVGLDADDVLLGWLPLYHDMGLIGIVIQTVLLGARCVLMSPLAFLQRPMRWLAAVSRYGATLSGGPDFAYDLCVRRSTAEERAGLDLSRWRVAFNGAEPVRAQTLSRFAQAFAPAGFRAEALCPCYGLAEATLLVSVSPPGVPPAVQERGRRLAGSGVVAPETEVAVVQPRTRRRLGEGQEGEIWVAGPQVAAGYWGRPRETARTFRARLAGEKSGEWLRTGDLGFLSGGELFVTGRIKDLIVIRGRNLYPQDVERTVEASHPALVPGGAAAFALEDGGRERLAVAAEVGRRFRKGEAGEAVAALRRAVAEEHEAEVWGVALLTPGTLPRTSSGKVRRQACREGFLARTLSAVAWETGGEPEEAVRSALARALGRAPEGEESRSLAALGLDSLAAVELQHALETRFGVTLPFPELLAASPAEIAARVESAPPAARPAPSRGEAVPTHGQRALWFLHRLDPRGTAYHVAFAARVRSGIDPERLGRAVAALVERHDALRTVFPERGGEPVAEVRDGEPEAFAAIDLPEDLVAAEAARPFDLAAGPVLRVRLCKRVLLIAAHHIAVDLWSLVVLMDELGRLLAGEELPPAGSFVAYALAERERLAGPEGERLWDFWRGRLGERELPVLDLPTDRPRPVVARFVGAAVPLEIPPEVATALKALAAEAGTTLFTVLAAAFQLLLGRLAGQDEVLLGSPAAGRSRPELAGVVGYLVNPVVLRGGPVGDPTGRELLARARTEVLGALAHQDFPFPLLVERLQPRRDPGRSPVFQALLALEKPHRLDPEAVASFVLGTPGEPIRLGPLELEPLPLDLPGAQLDLALTLIERESGLAGRLRYDADLFDATTASRWAGCFATLLAELAARPGEKAAELPLLSAAEQAQLRGDEEEAPAISVLGRFLTQAERTPDAPALIHDDGNVTYRELADRAGQLAGWLARTGVGPEERVGVHLPRTPDLVATILGVLWRGAAYVPLDPAYPRERIEWMVEDAGAAAVITPGDLPTGDFPIPLPVSGGLFAVIYTSGSTGQPKGVAVEERGVSALMDWAERAYSQEEMAGVLAATSVCFDLSIFEIFAPLTRGGAAVLADHALELPRLRHRVTLVNTVPSVAAALAGELPESVRTVNLAGEPLPEPLARSLAGRRVWNLYGPTETTVYSTGAEIGVVEGAPPIGRPLPGERVVLMDTRMQPVPPGVPGEIWIGGAGLARGYLGRPDATAERFRPDPWGRPGARLYRTGDLARLRPDGQLVFLGRRDHQMKIRGFRVEPGEVEAALLGHPAVAEAAVAARPEPGGGRRLVAWVAPAGEPAALRAYLEERLPAFLVPAAFIVLPRLPRTPNGKVDRSALPEPGEGEERAPSVPRTPVEEVLAAMWSDLLGREAGPADDFFALGGHSLLAARLASRVREAFGVELPISLLFRAPTLAGLAVEVARLRGEDPAPPLRAVPRNGPIPLSFAQRRLWFLDRLEPGSPRYNVPVAVHFEGALDSAALEGALRELVRRHESLRTRFPGPVQEIDPEPDLSLSRIDLSELHAEARRPFDLARGPVVRARLLFRGAESCTLLLVFHHIAVDGWSLALLLRELAALLRGEQLPPPGLQMADFALWQRQGEIPAARLAAARARLDGVPDLDLRGDRPRPPVQSARGHRRPLEIPAPLAASLTALGRQLGATPFMVLLAVFEALLGRWTGQEDFAVGAPVAGRDRVETEGTVGVFVNTLALRASLAEEIAFAALVARVREDALAAYEHRDLPFEALLEGRPRDLSRAPLFQAMLSLVDVPLPVLDLPGIAVRVEEVETGVAKLDLTLELTAREGGLSGSLETSADLFDPATAELLAGHFLTLLEGALAEPDLPWTLLPLVSLAERRQLLGEAQGPPLADSAAPAVVWEGGEISRGELRLRAGGLARRLVARGVGPEEVVAVRVERSPELAVALLAVLEAGGAFLPLDPAHPPERLAGLLADAGAKWLLVRAGDPPPPAGWAGEALEIGGERGEFESRPVHPEQAAYAIYTSGSTGRPKGVIVPHRALAGLCRAAAERYGLTPGDRVLAFASPAFDVMVEELFATWAAGAVVVLAPAAAAASLDHFVELLARQRVTVANLPASFWHVWGDDLAAAPPPESLRLVVAGSERLSAEKVVAWRRGTRVRLLNAYGVTEAAVTSAVHEPGEGAADPVPVGWPLAHAEAVLLDRWGGRAPVGAPGELALGGPGLARGYLGRPDLTAERFVPGPLGERLYRTGDLARARADGALEILGRIDHQLKVRGVRVEPGEVEAVLESHPEVAQAAVGLSGPRLTAWVVLRSEVPADSLRAFLAARLPDALVPAAWVFLDALPLTASGKVDRRALPAPESAPGEIPRTPAEAILAEVWARALGVGTVGLHDSFFALGGDSILTLQVVAGARERGLAVTPRQIFEHPTVAALAAVAAPAEEPEPEEEDGGPFPLTPIQRWFFELNQPEAHHFNQSLLLVPEPRLVPGLDAAVAALVERHEALRLRFGGGEQWVGEETRNLFSVVDLTGLPAALSAAAAELQTGFDLAAGPLFRAVLFRRGGPDRLLLAAHHLAVDGVSWRILLSDLERACRQAVAGEAIALPPVRTSFRRWARLLAEQAPPDSGPLPGEPGLEGEAETVSVELPLPPGRPDEALLAALAQAAGGGLWVDVETHGRETDRFPGTDLSRTVGWFTSLRPVRIGEAAASPARPEVSFNYLGRFDGSGPFAPAPEPAGPERSPAARRTHRLEVRALAIGGRLRIDCTGNRGDRDALEKLAAELAAAAENAREVYPLTPAQQGILFHDRAAPGTGAYVEQITWVFTGGFDRRAFERAWSLVTARHAVLRTVFPEGEEPVQEVLPGIGPEWEVEDRQRDFDLARGPLQRLALFPIGEDRWRFVWSHHHALLDGWSMALVLEEVLAAYEAFSRGEELVLPDRRPFRDHVEWLLRQDPEAHRGFWESLLAGFVEPTPLGIDRPAARTEGYGERRLVLPEPGRRHGWTPATLVHAGWALVLSAYGGGEDVVFGSVVSGRTAGPPGVEGIVGLLANTLPVRVGLAAAEPLGPWLDRLQARLVEIRQREATPLPALRSWCEVPRDRPLFESLVVFENFPLGDAVRRWRGGSRIEDVRAFDRTHYPLTLVAADLSLTLLYDRGRFEEAALDRLEGHLAALFAGLAAEEDRPLSALSILTPAEAAQIAAWIPGAPGAGEGPSVHELFAARAAEAPEALAVVSGEDGLSLTYRELEERANGLARHLRSLGVWPEVPVALGVGRSAEAVVGLLAILKAGGFCVPVDPAYPPERRAFMLEDARPAVVLDDFRELSAAPVLRPPAGTVPLDALAYALYTSGSTGRPKGVAISHRLLRQLILWQMEDGVARGPRRTLQFAPWSFDVCLQEVFSTLCAGGTLVLVPEAWRADGPRLWRLIEEREVERLFLPFVALQMLAESAPPGRPLAPSLAEIATAGEQLRTTPAVAALFARLPGCALVNHYGPTETHVATSFRLEGPPASWPLLPPVGRAIAGTRVAVLDPWLRPVPVGIVGEICVGGGVGRGYLGRPDLTAERFLPDADEPGTRLYRTGDLGRLREDGEIEFLGRRDGQVKVRGVRVELGEIEAVLSSHEAVLRTAAAAGPRLVAAVVPRPGVEAGDLAAELRSFLAERLPAVMVPADLLILSELPLTPSGKVDRRALAELRPARPAATPPGTAIEHRLAGIWEELLHVPAVGLEDGFFELGGHSLLAGRLLARVRAAFGVDLSLARLLAEPSLGRMAMAVAGEKGREEAAIPRRTGAGPAPLSSAQQRMWLASPAGNLPAVFRLDGPLDVRALAAALTEVVRRHEVLRTALVAPDGEPVQIVRPPMPVPLPLVDLSSLDEEEGQRLAAAEARRPFDLASPPLLRAMLVRLASGSHLLLLTLHHAAADGWSIALLVRDLSALYGQSSPRPEPSLRYADYAAWQQERLARGAFEGDLAYWRQRLAGLASPEPAAPAGPAISRARVLPEALAAGLERLAEREGATLFMVLAAGFAAFLGRLEERDDVAFATPVAGRTRVETEELVGCFVNTLVLRIGLAGGPSFRGLLAQVRDAVAEAHAHQELPFERLVEELAPERRAGRPLVRTLLSFLNIPREPFALPGLAVTPLEVAAGEAALFDLALEAEPRDGTIALRLEVDGALWDAPAAARLLEAFEALLAAAVAHPDLPVIPLEIPKPALAEAPAAREVALGETADRLAALWAEVLGRPEVGVHDSFWDLGGHSLLAARIAARVRQAFGVDLPLATFFESSTPAELAAVLAGGEAADARPVSRADRDRPLPLSFGQQRLWFLHQLAPGSPAYNIPLSVRMEGSLDVRALAAALSEIVRRHEVLRTAFVTRRGEAAQEIAPPAPLPLPVADLEALPPARREEEARRLVGEESRRPFDLTRPPLLRTLLLRLGPEIHKLLLDLHHVAGDGWSGAVLVREAGALYAAFAEGRPSPLPGLPLQYADYARWQREELQGETLDHLVEGWRQRLEGLPPLVLPTDRPRPAASGFRGTRSTRRLSAEALERLAAESGATLFMVLAAGFAALLGALSGQEDFGLATPVAGRPRAELEGLIGFFVNTVVLRAGLAGDPTFRGLLARMRETVLDALGHQELPFERLVEEMGERRGPVHRPLAQALLVLQNVPREPLALPGLILTPEAVDNGTAKMDLSLDVERDGDGLLAGLEADLDLFDSTTAARMLEQLETLLDAAVADPDRPLSALPLLSPAALHQTIVEWNDGGALAESPVLPLHRLFEAAAARWPEAVAVTSEEEDLTYAELERRANRLARHLRSLGVGPETRVGLSLPPSAELVVALLAILKAGGAYVPLDPGYPRERLDFLMEDSQASLVLTRSDLEAQAIARCSPRPLPGGAGPDHPAYVIYTSGSTGLPKGVAVTHRNVVRLFAATASGLRVGGDDVWTLFHSFAFDFSVWEIWGALLHGGRLVVVPWAVTRDPGAFLALLRREGVTVLSQTPSAFRQLVPVACRDRSGDLPLRLVVFGGEALDPRHLAPWIERFGDHRPRLVNLYGITETTVHVTWRDIKRDDALGPQSPIGRALPHLSIRLLDRGLRPVPIGIPGEICVGGEGLARGYLGRPELTAERFVPDPFAPSPGARLYRSGDLARWRPDGDLEVLGRIDHQVKIRGFRIEPGEIEAALESHPGVEACAVLVRDEGRLVAWVVPREEGVPAADLRTFLADRLPAHMVPAAFVTLPALPLTRHGKLDREALPTPGRDHVSVAPFAPPETPVEKAVAASWAEVLDLPAVGLDDDFFALGGDSIRAIQVRVRAEERGALFTLEELFRHPTVRALSRMAGRTGADAPMPGGDLLAPEDRARLPEDVLDAWPVARTLAGLVFHSEYSPDYLIYLTSLHLQAPFDAPCLARALEQVVARHPVLRSSLALEGFSEPLHLIHREVPVPLEVEDLRGLSPTEQEEALDLWFAAEQRHKFDWRRPPLLRVRVHRRSDTSFQITLSEPFLDGWSVGLFLTELFHRYLALLPPGTLPAVEALPPPDDRPLAASFRDYVALEREALTSGEARRFWERRMDGGGAGRLPERPARRRSAPQPARALVGHFEVPIPPPVSDGLWAAARAAGAPLKNLLLAIHLKLLSGLAGARDVVSGVLANGRPEGADGDRVIGGFLNAMPFRLDLAPGSWADLARQVFDAERELLPYRRFPLSEIRQTLPGVGRPPFDTLFNFTHFHVYERLERLPGVEVLGSWGTEQTFFPLTAQWNVHEITHAVTLSLDHPLAELGTPEVEEIAARYARILTAVAADPGSPHDALSFLTETERQQILVEWNDTEGPQGDRPVHELFAEQAARAPGAPALLWGEEMVTYGDLAARAGRVTRSLLALGLPPEARAGLLLDRSPDLVAAILGILAAGAAYVPLDPAYPRERRDAMLEDSGARALVTRQGLGETGGSLIRLDLEDLAGSPSPEARPRVDPAQLFAVIYTSGSTGRPKGVGVEHRSVAALLAGAEAVFPPEERAGVLAAASICFDLSVFELFLPLTRGGTAILASNALDLPRLPARDAVRLAALVPSTAAELLRGGGIPRSVRTLFLGGEALPAGLARALQESHPGWRLLNAYGPTEATVYATIAPVRPAAEESAAAPPLGHAAAGDRVFLLDADLQPVLPGVAGEIWLGGRGITRGYLGRPDLTADRFRPDPFSEDAGARLYRTGDLGRRLPDGRVEFLGRRDHQVKIRGFRIELGDVEAALARHPGIESAVVVDCRDPDAPGEARLVAYAVPRRGLPASGAWSAELRGFVRRILPAPLVPSAFVILDALPLTPTGKVDRRALPAPESGRPGEDRPWIAPRTPVEEVLAGIWARVLGRERVSADDDFFALGGHSLLATQAVSRLREAFALDLPLRALFDAPVLSDLTREVERALREGEGTASPPLVPQPRPAGGIPLSFAQQRLWFLDRLEPESPFYNVPAAVRLLGRLDPAALGAAFAAIVRRHEALRTRFPEEGGRPVQVVEEEVPVSLPLLDLSGLPDREAEAARLARAEARRPFDLGRGPLLRLSLLRLGAEEHLLLAVFHHIVSDGWSLGVFLRETAALYTGETLPPLPLQYADFALWQRGWLAGEALERQLSWWRGQLADVPPLALPTDRPRPATPAYRGARWPLSLSPVRTSEGGTLFMTLLAAFSAVLGRWAGQERLAVGTPIAHRTRAELEPLIGFFVNTLALRADLAGDPTGRELLARCRETALGAYAHQDLSFEKIVEELRPERDLARAPLFQVLLSLQNTPLPALDLPGLTLAPVEVEPETAKFDLTLSAAETPEGIAAWLEYDAHLFDRATAARLARGFAVILESLAADPGRRLSELLLPPESERHQILREWGEAPPVAGGSGIEEPLVVQARRMPDALAVVQGDREMTYGELDARSESLARALRARGVGPETVVAIQLPKSPEAIVAILAVLRAGGAYLPLDPAYPEERLAWLRADARAALTLEDTGLAGGEGEELVPAPPLSPAYVLYTSGSTGRPKGVVVTRAGLLASTLARFEAYAEPVSAFLLLPSLAFDSSVAGLFWTLCQGGTLVLPEEGEATDPVRLAEAIARRRVSHWLSIPSLWGLVLDAARPGQLDPLSAVIVAGEPCPAELPRRHAAAIPGVPLVNEYGPTEGTVWATVGTLEAGERITIGRPIAGARVLLLDRDFRLPPLGVPAELFLGGEGLARGYLGRPDLTAERFVPDPFAPEPGARLYRTGDLARWLPDGRLDLLGRADDQVKIRGFRIEPGEIEAALERCPGVRQAAVVVRDLPSGDRRLAGFVAGDPDLEAVRRDLASRLPAHMVPAELALLDALPLSPNGKVDRAALRALPAARSAGATPPADDLERRLAAIWEELLDVRGVGREDGFFDLGGHSLLAVQLVARIESDLGRRLPLAALFRGATLASLAAELRTATAPPVEPPLVPLREGGEGSPFFWFHALDGSTLCYADLASRLPGRPLYGLESTINGTTIEHLALCYAEAIARLEPRGPVLLGGWSFGGLLAWETAHQLRKQGCQVELLALVDSHPPDPAGPPDLDVLCGYSPPPLDCPVALYLAEDRPWEEAVDRAGLWRPLARGGLHVETIPGDHFSVLTAPSVDVLAAKLLRRIA